MLRSLVAPFLIAGVFFAIGKHYIDTQIARQKHDIQMIFKIYGVELYDAIQTETEQTSKTGR